MKKFIPFLKYLFLFIFLLTIKVAFAQSSQEVINDYTSEFTINKNGTVDVVERIIYDFGSNQRHGIYRDIPYLKENQDGKKFKITIDKIKVTDEYDNNYKFSLTDNKSSGSLNIKIGDPNIFVSGIKTYKISYTLSGAISYFPNEHDEFYWNFIGSEWSVPIQKAVSIVKLGFETTKDELKISCFTGDTGSTASDCQYNILNNYLIQIASNTSIPPYSGMTIVIGFPDNLIAKLEPIEVKKTFIEKLVEILAMIFFAIVLPLISLYWFIILPIILFIKRVGYKKYLKENQKIVAAWFDPPKDDKKISYTPAETGALIDKKSDHKEVTATIIHLAQRGYLKIRTQENNKTIFEKLSKSTNNLKNFEKTLYDALFESGKIIHIDMYERSLSFGKSLSKFFEQVEQSLEDHKLFDKDLSNEKTKYIIIYVIGLITFNWPILIVNFFTRNNFIKFSSTGVQKYSEARSLYNFLRSQDEQLDFQAKNQMFFEKLLPYATAFGVEDIWTKRFANLKFVPNDWYEGDLSNLYTSSVLMHTISSSMTAASVYTSSRSSSGFSSGFSGGGFSGGGGGGGGGGSW